MIIEMLYESGGVMRLHYERIAFALRTQCDDVKDIIHNFDLFEVCEPGIGKDGKQIPASFTSRRVLENINMKNQKSKKASESAGRRWDSIQNQCERTDSEMRTQCERTDSEMRTQCDGNAIKERKRDELKETKEKETPPLPPKEKNQQNQGFQPDRISSQSHKSSLCDSDLRLNDDDDFECEEINSKPEPTTGRALREAKPPVAPATTNEERDAETKKRQKVMEWFLRYISIHPKKTKRYLVEQIWCETFFNPSLSDEDAKELYEKIISALQTQKDKHPRDDVDYKFFPAADAWLRDGRWMDEVETRQPETLQEQAARLAKIIRGEIA